jgi:hypothetical protein
MNARFLLYILTCGPFVIALVGWVKLYYSPKNQRHALPLLALSIASANAALACGTFLYYEFRPPAHLLPPWQDPEILHLALLVLLAPIAMIFGIIAGVRDAPKWVVGIVEIVSLLLFILGIIAGSAV